MDKEIEIAFKKINKGLGNTNQAIRDMHKHLLVLLYLLYDSNPENEGKLKKKSVGELKNFLNLKPNRHFENYLG